MGLRGRNYLTDELFFFVTTSILNFTKVFTTDAYCELLIKNIKYYQQKYQFEIIAYVIMPSHFHWIVKVDPKKGTISQIMRDIKKYSAWDILEKLERDKSPLINNFNNPERLKQKRQLWIHRFDDEVIKNQKMLWTKIKYIHNNPVKAGLAEKPEEYKYSSARNYILEDDATIYIEKSWAGIEMRDVL
ncbi:MAG: transposase [Bacteroidota bacterium]